MLVLSHSRHVADHRPKSEQLADAQYNWARGSKIARKKPSKTSSLGKWIQKFQLEVGRVKRSITHSVQ